VSFGGVGNSADLRFAEPACPIAGDQIVDGVAHSLGNELEDCCERERESEQVQHAEYRVGAEEDAAAFDHDDGADAVSLKTGMAQKCSSGFRLAGGEAKDVFVVEAQQEVDPAIAEGALAIEDHDWVRGGTHSSIVSQFLIDEPRQTIKRADRDSSWDDPFLLREPYLRVRAECWPVMPSSA
jgi:hypothetical protein